MCLSSFWGLSCSREPPPGAKRSLTFHPRLSPASDGAHYDEGGFSLAEDLFRLALAKDPRSLSALTGLGWTYLDSQRYEDAEFFFLQALQLDSRNEDALLGLGWVYYDLERYEQGASAFETLVLADPRLSRAWGGWGWCILEQGEPVMAQAIFERGIALDPGDGDLWNGPGMVFLRSGSLCGGFSGFSSGSLRLSRRSLSPERPGMDSPGDETLERGGRCLFAGPGNGCIPLGSPSRPCPRPVPSGEI